MTETETPKQQLEVSNRAERRKAARAKRRKGKHGVFNRTSAAIAIEAHKNNVASWEIDREMHELDIDKLELLIDGLDPDASGYAERVQALEKAISESERKVNELDVSITNAETRIEELQAKL